MPLTASRFHALSPGTARRSRSADLACDILSRRDLAALAWVGEQYALRLDQLEVLLGRGQRTAQRTAARFRAQGLVRSRPLLAGEPAWLWLTPIGARECSSGFAAWEPKLALLAHVEAVNWVRLFVRGRAPLSEWVCERQLLRERDRQEVHVPDAIVLLDRRSVAVEVELTVKSRVRTQRILDELSAGYDSVLYFTTPATRSHLERLGGTGRWPRLAIRDLVDVMPAVRS
jgi:hypothetical protein